MEVRGEQERLTMSLETDLRFPLARENGLGLGQQLSPDALPPFVRPYRQARESTRFALQVAFTSEVNRLHVAQGEADQLIARHGQDSPLGSTKKVRRRVTMSP